jgi:hypothetical protein
MGYTHYFTYKNPNTPLDLDKWRLFVEKVKKIIFLAKEVDEITICLGRDGKDPAILNDDKIFLNAVGNQGCETLVIERDPTESSKESSTYTKNTGFRFCKTNHRKYDPVVLAVLYELYVHFPNDFELHSDGDTHGLSPDGDHEDGNSIFENKYEKYEVPSSEDFTRDLNLLNLSPSDPKTIQKFLSTWKRMGYIVGIENTLHQVFVINKNKSIEEPWLFSYGFDLITIKKDFKAAIRNCLEILDEEELHLDDLDTTIWHGDHFIVFMSSTKFTV